MENEIVDLKKLLAATVDYVEALYGAMTNQIVQNRAILEAAKQLSPEFEGVYQEFLKDKSADDIRQKRSFALVRLSEVIGQLQQ